jgi:hypothetical protein
MSGFYTSTPAFRVETDEDWLEVASLKGLRKRLAECAKTVPLAQRVYSMARDTGLSDEMLFASIAFWALRALEMSREEMLDRTSMLLPKPIIATKDAEGNYVPVPETGHENRH